MSSPFSHLREFGNLRLDTKKQVVWFKGQPVKLHLKEIELLAVLTEEPGEVCTKKELLDRVWANAFVEESNLSRHIYKLRKTFEELGISGDLIETVPRRGYRFTGTVNTVSGESLIIERRATTRTLIEEYDRTDDQTSPATSPSVGPLESRKSWRSYLAVAAAFLVIAAGVAALSKFDLASTPPPAIRSIAVLPFRNTGEPGPSSIGFGMTDILTTRLANIDSLTVRPTAAVSEFENSSPNIEQIRTRLQVDAVIEGSVHIDGDKVLITARLVRVSDNSTIWSQQLNRPKDDISALQDELALQVVNALALDISGEKRSLLTKRFTSSSEAMQLYLDGRYHWSKRSNEGIYEAERLFREAAALDPDFALAYVGIADTMIFSETVADGGASLSKALELDPENAEALATRGFINMFHHWNWAAAEADFKKSIELKPGYVTSHQWYGTLLMMQRRHEEAKERLSAALRIYPTSYNILTDLGQAHFYAGEYGQAEEYCRRALAIYPDFMFAHNILSDIYFKTERYESAIRENMVAFTALSTQPAHSNRAKERIATSAERHMEAFEQGGVEGYWRFILAYSEVKTKRSPNEYIAFAKIRLHLGDPDGAFEDLRRAVEQRAFLAPFINSDPVWDPLRSDPRFQGLLAEMGLQV